jgi:uncharacterized surface protein with fasciclin (FAS1) repeats
MYKDQPHHAMTKGHPYYHGMPQAYRMHHYGHLKRTNGGAFGTQKTAQAQPNLVDVAASAGSFNTLLTAVKAAGLADTLAGEGPFTFLRPPTRPLLSCRRARSRG